MAGRRGRKGLGARKEGRRGVVLLLVLMVTSVLIVLVGRFSYGSALDGALARNQLVDVQADFDMAGAVNVLKAAFREGEPENPLELDFPSGRVTIRWTDESGKFNLNSLRSENPALWISRLERLFALLEEEKKLQVPGSAGEIADFVLSSRRPLFTLGELGRLRGITEEVLEGGVSGPGLADYLTVYTDGKIFPGAAPDEVLECLDEGVSGQASLAAFKELIADPTAKVPGAVRAAARRLSPLLASGGGTWRAFISLEGPVVRREAEVVLRRDGEGGIVLSLYQEKETDGASFRRE